MAKVTEKSRIPLTMRQETVLQFIIKTISEKQRAPSLREIAVHLGVSSTNGISEHLEKLTFSAYPQLREKLLPPEQQPYVLLCGIESHICVLQTAMDLKAHGYQPYLVADCLSSRKPADHRMALERAKQEGILLTTCEATLFELLAAAGTPDSKVIQKIIK